VFLTGTSDNNDALLANAGGAATISIDSSESEVDMIKEGDQIIISSFSDYSDKQQLFISQ
jgi:hypothetical protein